MDMQQHQLRVGDWFYHTVYERYQKITASHIDHHSQYLEPIDLNNSWIFNVFGFEQNTTFNLIPPKRYFYKSGFMLNKRYQPITQNCDIYLLDYFIDYVHELQEAYYIIMNKVLDQSGYSYIDPNQNIIKKDGAIQERNPNSGLEQI